MNIKKKVVFIADKGFFSQNNVAEMESKNLQYIIPVHRNNVMIGYEPLQEGNYEKMHCYCRDGGDCLV